MALRRRGWCQLAGTPACWRPVGAKTHDSRQRSGLSRSPCESKRIGACGSGTVRGDGGDGDEGYRFRIEADDGQLMATSEPYTSKSSALKGVEAIKRNAAVAQIDDESGDDQDATATPRAATPDA